MAIMKTCHFRLARLIHRPKMIADDRCTRSHMIVLRSKPDNGATTLGHGKGVSARRCDFLNTGTNYKLDSENEFEFWAGSRLAHIGSYYPSENPGYLIFQTIEPFINLTVSTGGYEPRSFTQQEAERNFRLRNTGSIRGGAEAPGDMVTKSASAGRATVGRSRTISRAIVLAGGAGARCHRLHRHRLALQSSAGCQRYPARQSKRQRELLEINPIASRRAQLAIDAAAA